MVGCLPRSSDLPCVAVKINTSSDRLSKSRRGWLCAFQSSHTILVQALDCVCVCVCVCVHRTNERTGASV